MKGLVFKVANIHQAPDGDPEKYRTSLKTSTLKITAIVIRLGDIDRAVAVANDLVDKEGVQALLLCPGFDYKQVEKVAQAVNGRAAIFVARGDVPNSLMSADILAKEKWFPEKH